jgi:hypothetical protein
MSEYISKVLRARIAIQARHRCGYCLTTESIVGMAMEIDHIAPKSLGGLTEEDNLWLACSQCNKRKTNRINAIDPKTKQLVPLFNPRLMGWFEHFAWTQNGKQIVGQTPIGRATIVALNLNRPRLVKARRLWSRVGLHPPKD